MKSIYLLIAVLVVLAASFFQLIALGQMSLKIVSIMVFSVLAGVIIGHMTARHQ